MHEGFPGFGLSVNVHKTRVVTQEFRPAGTALTSVSSSSSSSSSPANPVHPLDCKRPRDSTSADGPERNSKRSRLQGKSGVESEAGASNIDGRDKRPGLKRKRGEGASRDVLSEGPEVPGEASGEAIAGGAAEQILWNGLSLRLDTLELQSDYTRYRGIHMRDTLSIELCTKPGQALRVAVKRFIQPKVRSSRTPLVTCRPSTAISLLTSLCLPSFCCLSSPLYQAGLLIRCS
jgi:hypothetical protein